MTQIAEPRKLSFDNTEIAFKSKTDKDLDRAYLLYKVIASNFLVKVGPPITNFALNIGLPIQGIIKSTIFKQFCGGETIEGCTSAINHLGENNVGTILDYSVEGEDTEAAFDATFKETLRTVVAAKTNKYIPFSVFKPTGLGRFELFEKVNANETLTEAEQAEYNRMYDRCDEICKACYEANVKVLIDAEHSWIQDAIDDIARDMMEKYNKEQPIVYNTYQLYRHDKLASLKADFDYAKTQNFFLGAKIVRGAYMEIERQRAAEKGYPSPIQPTKEATDKDYDAAIHFILDHIDRFGVMAGTHNEASSLLLANELDRRGIDHRSDRIFFAQLLGMSDNLTFNLSESNYNVAKYMPYGPIKAVMPYLFRRAQENTSVAGQTGRELGLIIKEKQRRKASR
ncbi:MULTISPECIES: proline dehydrogenase family protein [Sphingobacterium]|uniref:Proline dehydrogenase family protein n=2 Tax=Sphingobacterium TaxID=28453 RepID=A0ABW5YPZ5_9SPHI|nr:MULTISPECIES: proline dehydrogenase family protein [Sphingobacterium]MCS3556329.1 proline dehydrogenase [Sphingobacterium sp. JUb21]MCW2259943.1 proline dehydrogenase [Sphingobacterium kitahiroshimense]NJI72108.1 proline dehydrogenase [Sphingobacterium sp. B16(2022)]QQD12073.1 proline dehydrogenase family protein [Sphingobacterium sp. UDSM-2020]TCR08698.1 L-proline dehydrogenase [Sphingobacterium sp. JUb20]